MCKGPIFVFTALEARVPTGQVFSLGPLPGVQSCLLVDSRHSNRVRMKKDGDGVGEDLLIFLFFLIVALAL